MKLNLLFLFLVLLTSFRTFSNEGEHSAQVCLANKPKVCGHIGHMKGMKPNVVSSFVAHLSFPKGEKVADFKVVLWMPDMGHGTSAVELSPMGANKYNVSKANFTMAGAWEVQLKFKINSDEYQINIPIKITE